MVSVFKNNALLLLLVFFVIILNPAQAKSERRFTYHEHDGIFVYYETKNRALYREVLPEHFDMPDRLYVYTFVSDFYKMDSRTDPYKEASIFLLAKYQGREVWHCVFMPVTSEVSRRTGVRRLGLPKTLGDVQFKRSPPAYFGAAVGEGGRKMSLSVNTKGYTMSRGEERLIRELSMLPKLNILNGKVIEMSGGRKRSIIDLAKRFPRKLVLKPGKADVRFIGRSSHKAPAHALDLAPSRVLGGYYLLNKITFRLGKK